LGGRDPLLDETRIGQSNALLRGAETHRLASAGHFPMETHSKALRDYLRGWLRYNE
jgi:pimeloyl-ACP methyl ester carboxylesterase